MISTGIGRYGPFVLHNGTYANLESVEDVFSIGLNRAISVLADKQSKGAGGGRASAAALKELGEHPDGGAITVRDGRFGPYVNWGKVNATLPRGKDPQSVTVEEALALIAEREAKGGVTKGKAAKGKPTGGKSAGTKSAKAASAGTAKAEKPKSAAKTNTKAAAKAKKD